MQKLKTSYIEIEIECFSMKGRLIAVAILLIIIVIIGLYEYQSMNGPLLHTTYSLGDKINGFHVTEMSLTFCNITTSQTVITQGIQDTGGGAGIQGEYVILTVAIHKLEEYQIYFNRASDFGDRFSNAVGSYTFVLTYGDENHQVPSDYYFSDSNGQSAEWQMGILFPNAQDITSLAPNQTIYGYIYFPIGEYYTPNQVLCIQNYYTNANSSPTFAVNLKS